MYQDRNYHDFVKMSHSSTQGNRPLTVVAQIVEFQIIQKVAIKVNENHYSFITLIAEDISDDESTILLIHDIEDLVPVIFSTEDLGGASTQKVAMEIGGSRLQYIRILTEQSVIHPETGEQFRVMKPRDENTHPHLITLYKDFPNETDLLKTSLASIKIEVLAVYGFVAL